ncbi:Protein kinase C-like 1 [Dinochytrium kinnereticum]|nr:Protein kinase C-like 1 [Dinochytrium kinnereticum]
MGVAVSAAPLSRFLATSSLDAWKASIQKATGLRSERTEFIRNPSASLCYEDAIRREGGTRITSTGTLAAYSGLKTGRSPSDKRIVREDAHKKNVWWGPVNVELSEESFAANRQRAMDYLGTKDRLYVVDAFAGWDPRYRLKIRVICSRAYHALFMTNMLIRPTEEELANFGEPDFTIYNGGQFPANVMTKGVTSPTSVALSFDKREFVILGTE